MHIPREAILGALTLTASLDSRGNLDNLDVANITAADPIFAQITPIANFNVTGFTAEAVVFSHRNSISFQVEFSEDHPSVHCGRMGTTFGEVIGGFAPTWCNRERDSKPNPYDVWFSLSASDTDPSTLPRDEVEAESTPLELRIMRQISDTEQEEAVHTILGSDIPIIGEGQFRHQEYQGPENFTVPAVHVRY